MKTWSFALVRGSLCAFWSTVNEEHFGTLTFGPAAICSKYFSIESQINIALSATLISSIQLVPQNWRGNVVQPVNSVTSCRLARDSLNKYQNDLSKHYIFQPVFFSKPVRNAPWMTCSTHTPKSRSPDISGFEDSL